MTISEQNLQDLFFKAYEKNLTKLVAKCIEHGADPTAGDNCAIQGASCYGCDSIVKLLPEHGADPTAQDNYAIRWASRNGHVAVVKLLLEHGADPIANNNYAIQWASENGHAAVVEILKNWIKNNKQAV